MPPTDPYELVIVGAGPAGLSAAARAQARGLRYLLLERSPQLADTIFRYQKGKHVMAEPRVIPLRSDLRFGVGSREEVMGAWQEAAGRLGLEVRLGWELQAVERLDGSFRLTTDRGELEARKVVLAVGTQGNPRKLGVEGEDQPHVSTRLVDPDDHREEDIVVVGAGDSALEVTLALADHNRVHLVVRRPEIIRAKEVLEREVLKRQASGDLEIHFSTTVGCIEEREVLLRGPEREVRVPADRVFLKLGATPPRSFLEGMGVTFSGSGKEARPELDGSYQTRVPGLYVVGATTGRDLIKLAMNQGYEVVEHIAGVPVEPADEEVLKSRLPVGEGSARERLAALTEALPMLAAAGEEELRELFLSAEVKDFPAGATIVAQNDYTDSFLLIVSGEVSIASRPEGAAEEERVATLRRGDFFGEMGLISGRRRTATAKAESPSRLVEIPRKAMLKLLATSPGVARRVDETFVVRAFQSYLFPEVPMAELAQLAARAKQVRLDKGEVLFREGDDGDAFYLIRHGMVGLSKQSGDREIVLTYLVAGNFFGEIALLAGVPRTATVTAIFPSELIRLDKDDLGAFLDEHPELRPRLEEERERRHVETLLSEATPGSGEILHNLIRKEVVMGTDALLIDEDKCVRCDNCLRACEGVHDDGQARLSLTGIKLYNLLVPNSCWQCEDPLCMLDCPPDALVRDPRGEIHIKSTCIGCGNCETNCPYGNIFMVHPRQSEPGLLGWVRRLMGAPSVESTREVAVKCDLCSELPGGPACVRSCPTGAALRVNPEEYQLTIESLVAHREGG